MFVAGYLVAWTAFGLVAYGVETRQREFAVRMALSTSARCLGTMRRARKRRYVDNGSR
jgi:predicted metal-binding membrane protein